MDKYALKFDGYWKVTDTRAGDYPGVYCLYIGSPEIVDISRLLYIGESENIQYRIARHMQDDDMIYKLTYDACNEYPISIPPKEDRYYFSAAKIANERDQVEAAMINYHKPPTNDTYVNDFPFPDTKVFLEGEIHGLSSEFIVYQGF